jgi:5'-3' exonuclease
MKIAVIDADHILYNVLHGIKVLDENNEPVKIDGRFVYEDKPFEIACLEAKTYLDKLMLNTTAEYYVGFYGGSSKRRKEINPTYKANRKDFEKPKNFDLMQEYFEEELKFYRLKGFSDETDDYVLSYASQIPNSFIVSPDKDLLNTIGYHFNPKKEEWINTSLEYANYYFWFSMIVGDSADGVIGVKGRGEKFAEKYLQNTNNYEGKVLDLYIQQYGQTEGINQFYKTYHSLLILKDLDISSYEPIYYKYEITTE